MPWHTKAVVRKSRTKSTWRNEPKKPKNLVQRILDILFK
jgi:hypothetical protein